MTPRDDDALSWDGDDDPTLDPGGPGRAPRPPEAADPPAPEQTADAAAPTSVPVTGSTTPDAPPEPTADDAPAGLGNASLVALGVLGGVYLLFAIGWLIGGMRLQEVAALLVSSGGSAAPPTWSAGNAAALVLAVAAPPIWFAVTLLLTRGGRPWVRWALLAAGVVLLVPWPFVMMGAIGS